MNDMWKFDGENWTWISGSESPNEGGVYGSKGIQSNENVAGARFSVVSWKGPNGTLWFFGGYGYSSENSVGMLLCLFVYLALCID